MTGTSFATFTRRASDVLTRRRSALALGAAMLGAAAMPRAAEAGQCGKKVKQGKEQQCENLVKQCKAGVAEVCAGRADENICIACEECCSNKSDCVNKGTFACLLGCFDLLGL